jgi:hypothetical protein
MSSPRVRMGNGRDVDAIRVISRRRAEPKPLFGLVGAQLILTVRSGALLSMAMAADVLHRQTVSLRMRPVGLVGSLTDRGSLRGIRPIRCVVAETQAMSEP